MLTNPKDPFFTLPNTLDTSTLERACKPLHRVLAELIEGCSSELGTSTIATAALVTSLWQLRGQSMSDYVPSLILLNAAEAAPDPIDSFVKSLVDEKAAKGSVESGRICGVPIKPEDAPAIMERAVRERRALGYRRTSDLLSERNARIHEQNCNEASKFAHGTGGARAYAKGWAKGFGLLTDEDDRVILRLEEARDRAAFRKDILENPGRLLVPEGIGRHLLPVRKGLSVSGSLTVELWDEELVTGIIKLGLPFVFLPHTATEPLAIPNPEAMRVLPGLWRDSQLPRARTSLTLPPVEWFEAHASDFRRRLHLLPENGAYGFAMHQLVRQLGSVCHRIAKHAGNNTEAEGEQIAVLFWDLHARAFRGVTLGVAALSWHCLGFNPGCPLEQALRVLNHIREKGTVRKPDLLLAKGCRVDAKTRDVLLERLAAEDLIRVQDKTVTAASFAEFVTALHLRPSLPGVEEFDF